MSSLHLLAKVSLFASLGLLGWLSACGTSVNGSLPANGTNGGEPSAASGGRPATGGAGSKSSGGQVSSAGGARPNPNPSTGGAGTGGRNSAGGAAADTESGGNNSASGGQSAVCPARTPSANQFVVYGEGVAAAWSAYGFSGNFAVQSATVCSGAEALQYVAHQYDGVAFDTPDPNAVPATHLSIRVHVNVASAWAFAAVTVGQTDPHQFIGESTLQPGWQVLELDIPNTTPMTRWLLLEKQDAGNATLTVDDVRLTR